MQKAEYNSIECNSTYSKVRKQPKLVNILLERTRGRYGRDFCRRRGAVLGEEPGVTWGLTVSHVSKLSGEQTIWWCYYISCVIYFVLFF